MKLSPSVLVLGSVFLLSSVSCSVSAECRTSKKAVLEQFSNDTNAVFEKLADIKECGKKNSSGAFLNSGPYKDCISDLNLPLSYEKGIADLMSFHFKSDYDFRQAISSAATSCCFKLNHEHFFGDDDLPLKTYRINSMILPKTNKRDDSEPSTFSSTSMSRTSVSSTSSSSSFFDSFRNDTLIMFGGFLLLSLLLFGMAFLFAKWRLDKMPDKMVSEIHIKRDTTISTDARPDQQLKHSNNSIITIESYPVRQNDMPPPPSYQEIRMDYPTTPVNNVSSMPNPYSYDKKPF